MWLLFYGIFRWILKMITSSIITYVEKKVDSDKYLFIFVVGVVVPLFNSILNVL